MKARQEWVKGSPKEIVFASPIQVIGIKKQYLKSLSPNKASENVNSSMSQIYPLPNKVSHRHYHKTSRWLRKHSINYARADRINEDLMDKEYLEDFAFRGLRINNL